MGLLERAYVGLTGQIASFLVLLLLGPVGSGCGVTAPSPHLDAYLGTFSQPDAETVDEFPAGLRVGLAVVNDVTGSESAPALTEDALVFVTDQARRHVGSILPLSVVAIASPSVRHAGDRPATWDDLAHAQQVDHLLLAVISSVEITSAMTVPLDGTQEGGGAMGRLPGSSTVQHALAELALVDAQNGTILARAEGRTMSTLEQLTGGLTSNAYPVIRRSGRMQRIAAPRDDGEAHDFLRSLAADEAIELAAYNLKGRWKRERPVP